MVRPIAFDAPVYVTVPLLPDLDDLKKRLEPVWAAQWLTNGGAQLSALEARLTAYLKAHSLSIFNNGTIALLVGLRALELTGEVITTPFTFAATAHSIVWNGLKPVFADITPDTMCLDPARIEAAITPQTSAILAVHVYGNVCDAARIQAIADRHGLKVIYDAAHAFGCEVNGRPVAQLGDLTMFSFHATKLFHTAEGGALAFGDPALRQRVELLKNFGIAGEGNIELAGLNGKVDELRAALGLAVLDVMEAERERRAGVFAAYHDALVGVPGVILPEPQPGHTLSYQYFPIRIGAEFGLDRDTLHARLQDFNVHARRYFHPLVPDFACYRDSTTCRTEEIPVARQVVREVLCLPCFGALGPDGARRIVEMIRFIRG